MAAADPVAVFVYSYDFALFLNHHILCLDLSISVVLVVFYFCLAWRSPGG